MREVDLHVDRVHEIIYCRLDAGGFFAHGEDGLNSALELQIVVREFVILKFL